MGVTKALVVGAFVATVLGGCSGPAAVVVRVQGGPDEALVHINDRYIGKLGRVEKAGVKLVPGRYRLTVEANGFFPHDEIVEVGEGAAPAPVDVALEPVPD
jgi:PEGA domain